VAERVQQYRLNAEKCLALAQTSNNLEAKRSLLVMANAWLMLAAQRNKYIEPAPPASDPPLNERPRPNEPPTPPPVDEPPNQPQPPPVNEPPQRLDSGKPDDLMQC
jgi:hypothetical protein